MKMIKGAHFKASNKLKEEYEIQEKGIIANISSNHIEKLFRDFIDVQDGPLFLIIEIPTNKNEEDSNLETFHKDVYYADGLNKECIYEVMNRYGYLFINDGLSQIGIGNHTTVLK